MKNLFTASVLFALTFIQGQIHSQVPNWQWAKSTGGSSNDSGSDVSIDNAGNVYVTGSFNSPSLTFGTTTLTNTGGYDIFIVKYDASGNVLWAKSAGGTNTDSGNSIATDVTGNVFVRGIFYSPSLAFGSTTLNNAVATGTTSDIFVVKYDAAGNVLWAKSAGGINDDNGEGLSSDVNGNVYVTGYFQSPSLTVGTTTLINNGSSNYPDMFIAKYDGLGNALWAKSAGGTNSDYGSDVTTDAAGNVYVTGYFFSSLFTSATTTLTNLGTNSNDIFIIKYDASGNTLWAKSAGGNSYEYCNSITHDAAGNIYLTGDTQSSSITFGTITLSNSNVSGSIFVAKYDALGNAIWAKSATGTNFESGYGISADVSGNTYVTGGFDSPSITIGTTTLTNAGSRDILVIKYDSSGNLIWAKSVGGTNSDGSESISSDANGNVYVTGYFQSSSVTFGTTTLNNTGNKDIFIAKVSDNNVGISEYINYDSEYRIFPNPFAIQAVLSSNNNLNNATLTIKNYLGQIVKEIKNISGQNFILFRDNLPEGIYFFSLYENLKPLATGKLVISDK